MHCVQDIHHQTFIWSDSQGTPSGTYSVTHSLTLIFPPHLHNYIHTHSLSLFHSICSCVCFSMMQTFVMEMMPKEAKTYKHISHCVLNATSNYTQVPPPPLPTHTSLSLLYTQPMYTYTHPKLRQTLWHSSGLKHVSDSIPTHTGILISKQSDSVYSW